jgi:putative ABC transport system permease protein
MIGYVPLVLANLRRRPLRTAFTLGSILVAFLLFGVLGAMTRAFSAGAELAGADRLMVIHKVSLVQPLPESYRSRIRQVNGVARVSSATWFGGVYQDDRNQLPTFPVDDAVYLDIYPEYVIPPEGRQRWLADRRGAIVGRAIAEEFGWKVGDTIPLRSNIWRQADGSDTWQLNISSLYDVPESGGGDPRNILMHYDYFEESRGRGKGLVSWYVVQVSDPAAAPRIAREIDAQFANSPYETETATEKAFAQSFVNQIGNIGAIMTGVVSAVFFTMLLVTANTMAQSVRERTPEIGVLKTLGFTGGVVTALVLAESILLTGIGGVLGMIGAYGTVEAAGGLVRQYLPVWEVPPDAWLTSAGLMLLLGLLAGAVPAWSALRLPIVQALRES